MPPQIAFLKRRFQKNFHFHAGFCTSGFTWGLHITFALEQHHVYHIKQHLLDWILPLGYSYTVAALVCCFYLLIKGLYYLFFLYACLGNPLDRGAWQATVHGVTRVGHDSATKPPPPLLSIWGFPGGSDGKESGCNVDPLTLNCTQVDEHRQTIKTPVICHLFHVPGVQKPFYCELFAVTWGYQIDLPTHFSWLFWKCYQLILCCYSSWLTWRWPEVSLCGLVTTLSAT